MKTFNTNIEDKRKYWPVFAQLVSNQFEHGGDKYAFPVEGKEATDWVCELVPGDTGVDWILGTCAKYLGRFKTFRREKDLLKVATYMFIAWLKMGYHLRKDNEHDEDTNREK